MLEMRPVRDHEFLPWIWAEARAYGNRLDHDPEELRPHFDLERSIAVFEGRNIVGGAHSHRVEMSVPGAVVGIAGVANIAVQPTHRRQGVLTRMMRHQIADIHERGEPLAALFASESAIYGRFGYGIGSLREHWTIDRQHNSFARAHQSSGRIAFVEPADIARELPAVARRSTAERPGMIQKPPHLWEREAHAPEHQQGGPGGLFYIAYEGDNTVEGYAKYRTAGDTLTVLELMATTHEANAALWRFCFDIDLVSRTAAEKRPVDDPLPWLLADPRRLHRSTRDGVWLRLVDVAKSLSLRRYALDGVLTLEVWDDICPWNKGRFRLEASGAAGGDGATCHAVSASPDLALEVRHLAAAYLGAVSFSTLAAAGLIEERTPGALQQADRMFAVRYQPWTPNNF